MTIGELWYTLWTEIRLFNFFCVTEQSSCTLQGKDTTIQEARESALLSECYLRRLRSDQDFTTIYEEVVQLSHGLTEEPVLPRKRKLPRRINDGADSHQFSTPKDYYRQQYFQALDEVTNVLTRSFDQQDMKIALGLEVMLLSACVSEVAIPQLVQATYQNDLDFERLKTQLNLLPDLLIRHKEITGYTIKKVTNIRTLCDVINNSPAAKHLRPQIHSLLKLYLTIPITTATAERAFSTIPL